MKPWHTTFLAVVLGLAIMGLTWDLIYGGGKKIAPAIRVGSKDFTENQIVAELYALALENAGYQVERYFDLAGSVAQAALVNYEIDLYPEYTGTGLMTVLKMPLQTDPAAVYATVKKEYEKRFQMTWLDPSRVNDSQGLVMRAEVARELGITNISALQRRANQLRFASQGDFDHRPDGLPGLVKVYGPFNWQASRVYDPGRKYQVLLNGEADVAPAFATEGQLLDRKNFLLLKDDRQAWPPNYLAPVISNSLLAVNPELAPILNSVSAALDNATMTRLNAKVAVDKQEVDDVARGFFPSVHDQLAEARR